MLQRLNRLLMSRGMIVVIVYGACGARADFPNAAFWALAFGIVLLSFRTDDQVKELQQQIQAGRGQHREAIADPAADQSPAG